MAVSKSDYMLDDLLSDSDVVHDEREEEDDDKQPIINGYSTIDLSSSSILIEVTSTATSSSSRSHYIPVTTEPHRRQEGYQPKTLSNENQTKRFGILPKFPTADPIKEPCIDLLLTAIPFLSLSSEQMYLRRHCCDDLICYENSSHSPSTREETNLLYKLFVDLSQQWHVPIPLLASNYEFMVSSMYHLSLLDFVEKVPSLALTIDDWKIALEFYLQMDTDCFFLKTCSFRGSQPRRIDYITHTENESLFCFDPPEARYGMKRCHYDKCLFCRIPNRTHRYEPALKFTNHQIHTFVNQYQAILNCDVTCSSSHVIYTLTCPCEQYDYIGRTNGIFYKRLYFHRIQCSRIIREFLLGKMIVHRMSQHTKSDWILKKDSMDLYRHIVNCPVALRIFFKYHFVFWCLVPMSNTDADSDDQLPMSDKTNFLLQCCSQDKFNQQEATQKCRSDVDINWCIDHLPLPPATYRFSKRQRQEQYYFFKVKLDIWPLSRHLDIYNATVVIALPNDCSSQVLHFVQALLVTHTDCKLNTTTARLPSHFDRPLNWCQNLKRS